MDTSNAERRQFGISGVTVSIPAPFKEGHQCNEHEAGVLNQVLAENCRNNKREEVVELLKNGGSTDQVQALVDAYVVDYDFGQRRLSGPRLDPVESSAMELATEVARRAAKKRGEKLADISASDMRKRAADILAGEHGPALRARAETIAKAKDLDIG